MLQQGWSAKVKGGEMRAGTRGQIICGEPGSGKGEFGLTPKAILTVWRNHMARQHFIPPSCLQNGEVEKDPGREEPRGQEV